MKNLIFVLVIFTIFLVNCGSPTHDTSHVSIESREGKEVSKEGRERKMQETGEMLLNHPNQSAHEVLKQEQARTSKSYRDEKIMADLKKQLEQKRAKDSNLAKLEHKKPLEQKRAKDANLAKLEQELDEKVSYDDKFQNVTASSSSHHSILGEFIDIVSSPVSFQFGEKGEEKTATLKRSFSLMKVPVTQRMLKALNIIKNPSHFNFKGDDRPVENITYDEIFQIINELNKLNDGYLYDLPTEEEWEYAARGGVEGEEYLGGSYEKTFEYAWAFGNCNETQPVGHKKPNGFGLYDMIGNVYELTKSKYNFYGPSHVIRGGAWNSRAGSVRVASRINQDPGRSRYAGFRLLRTKSPPTGSTGVLNSFKHRFLDLVKLF